MVYCLAKVQKSWKNITLATQVSGLHRYPVVIYMKKNGVTLKENC